MPWYRNENIYYAPSHIKLTISNVQTYICVPKFLSSPLAYTETDQRQGNCVESYFYYVHTKHPALNTLHMDL